LIVNASPAAPTQPARYLVTGGCGFIGSHLVDAIAAEGHRVRVLDDLSTGMPRPLPPGIELVTGDVSDRSTVRAVTHDVQGCFHLAAIASVAACNAAWSESHGTNLSATIGLFEVASSRGRPFPVVYASSAAVYGDSRELPLREDLPVRPLSPYGADKAGCELHARAGALVRGLAATGLRFFNVYGPRQRPDSPYSGVISVFAERLRRGETLTVNGDGRQSRDFVYVGDVVRALTAAMSHLEARPGQPAAEVFNVCSGRVTTVLELARLLMRLDGNTVPVVHGPPRDGDIRHSTGSPELLAAGLGVRATMPLEQGLRRTLRDAPEARHLPVPAPQLPSGRGTGRILTAR
jgi:UDP-glucose 4-epimerase